MTIATTKLTVWWGQRIYVRVHAFRVAQGRIVPFLGEDVNTKLEIT